MRALFMDNRKRFQTSISRCRIVLRAYRVVKSFANEDDERKNLNAAI